jgi:SWI/SNF-related matrix-associated actin-dependent regulator 1 of chromatin subfamily A
MEHQEYAVTYALQHLYSVNGYQMGEGKTAIAISLILHTRLKAVVVCPAFLKLNWEQEIHKFSALPLKVRLLENKDLKTFEPSDEDIIVINYAIVKNAHKVFEWAECIVADESHYLGSPSSQRTRAFVKFVRVFKPHRLLLMSGSPIRGRVAQWYVPIKLCALDPKGTSGLGYDGNYHDFQYKFSNSRRVTMGNRSFTQFHGLRNEEELRLLLKKKFLRKMPGFELKLPELRGKEVFVDKLVNEKQYAKAWADYEKTKKLTEHIMSAKKENAAKKARFTFEYCKNILEAGEGPVVVFSDHRAPLDYFLEKAKKIKVRAINGDTPMETRDQYKVDFQAGKIDILVATIGAANTGITLTRSTNLVFNDLSWTGTENGQALKRIHRIGQNKRCYIHYILSGKIDKQINKVIRTKDEVIEKTVDYGG